MDCSLRIFDVHYFLFTFSPIAALIFVHLKNSLLQKAKAQMQNLGLQKASGMGAEPPYTQFRARSISSGTTEKISQFQSIFAKFTAPVTRCFANNKRDSMLSMRVRLSSLCSHTTILFRSLLATNPD
ncbi:MAG: hypothetical protein DMG96_16770 [Acidobacteria bacterium]|nr:MAG: hypothetical protein DMG96_16770 [Acidobacteriota bacterium]